MKASGEMSPVPEGGNTPPASPLIGKVFEGGEDFLEQLTIRLNEIVRKPNGRFVISYVSGQPGAKVPPRVQ